MREFIIKALIVAAVTGAWAGITVSEFGPSLARKSHATTTAKEQPPALAPSTPGHFGKEPRSTGGTDEGP